MNKLKNKIIFIKDYTNNIYFVKKNGKKYLTLYELECNNEITITTNILLSYKYTEHIYKHFENIILKPKVKIEKNIHINNIVIIDDIKNVYTVNIKVNNIDNNLLHYDYDTSLFKNDTRKLGEIYKLKHKLNSIIFNFNKTDEFGIMMRDKFYQIFFTNILEYIELIKEAGLYEQYLSIIYFYSTEKLLNDKEKIEGCECPICLLTVTQYKVYKCSHAICSDCLTQWNKINNTCSLCRST